MFPERISEKKPGIAAKKRRCISKKPEPNDGRVSFVPFPLAHTRTLGWYAWETEIFPSAFSLI